MELPNRKPTRLQGYDYSTENYYFVTICAHKMQRIFGQISGCNNDRVEFVPNAFGKIAGFELQKIPQHFDCVGIDKYVIMPNHVHAIIIIGCDVKTERSRPFPTLSEVVGLYKSGVSRQIHEINPGINVWQKSFYDRIIRTKEGYQKIQKYIDENPLQWTEDCFYNENC